MFHIKNRYNEDEVLTLNFDNVNAVAYNIGVVTKADILAQLESDMPPHVLFSVVASDVDLTKLDLFDKISYIQNNPDLDSEPNPVV